MLKKPPIKRRESLKIYVGNVLVGGWDLCRFVVYGHYFSRIFYLCSDYILLHSQEATKPSLITMSLNIITLILITYAITVILDL